MGLWENFKNLMSVSPDDEDDIGENTEETRDYDDQDETVVTKKKEQSSRSFSSDHKNKVVSYANPSQMQVVLVKPERFEDVPDIADHLNNKKTVVLNLEAANRDSSRRIIDFLSGVTYANKGTIKKIANSTFIIVPANVDFSGELMLDDFEEGKIYF